VAVALTGADGVTSGLLEILTHKKTRVHTRRGIAVALGKLLREGRMTDEEQERTRRTVMKVFDKDRDPLVQGYTAIAMGSAKPPIGIEVLMKTVDRTGSADVKPFAAIALGLAVKNLDERDAKRVSNFLVNELAKTRDIQLSGALSISVGLAGATAARDLLIKRVTDQRLNASIRGPACQAIGLLRDMSPRVEKALLAGLEDGSDEVVEDSCIAIGFIGGSGTARLLCDKLVKTRSAVVQAHMVVALSHLGGTAAIEPLLKIVANSDMNPTMRESAAAALGILCDPRETDPMFEIDASVNPYGLTSATRELVRIY
jgi:HEAT repeat protein